jgi:hypothetical protein
LIESIGIISKRVVGIGGADEAGEAVSDADVEGWAVAIGDRGRWAIEETSPIWHTLNDETQKKKESHARRSCSYKR